MILIFPYYFFFIISVAYEHLLICNVRYWWKSNDNSQLCEKIVMILKEINENNAAKVLDFHRRLSTVIVSSQQLRHHSKSDSFH